MNSLQAATVSVFAAAAAGGRRCGRGADERHAGRTGAGRDARLSGRDAHAVGAGRGRLGHLADVFVEAVEAGARGAIHVGPPTSAHRAVKVAIEHHA